MKTFLVNATWWVRAQAYGRGYYQKIYQALQTWLNEELEFKDVIYTNNEISS